MRSTSVIPGGNPAEVSLPLENHCVCRTHDLARITAVASELLGAHSIGAAVEGPHAAHIHSVALGGSRICFVRYGRPTRLRVPKPIGTYRVLIPLSGSLNVGARGELVISTGEIAIANPPQYGDVEIDGDGDFLAISVPPARIHAEARGLYPGPLQSPLEFDTRDTIHSRPLGSMVDLVMSTLERRARGVRAPGVDRQLEKLLLATILLGHSSNLSNALARTHDSIGRDAARHAASLMGADLMAPLDVTALAASAGVSVRTLQVGFRLQFGETPTQHHRRLRIARARAVLLERPDLSISEVAVSLGFSNASRFASSFVEEYGTLPSRVRRLPSAATVE